MNIILIKAPNWTQGTGNGLRVFCHSLKASFLALGLLLLTSCGGGSSSSGAPAAVVARIIVPAGIYEGLWTFSFIADSVDPQEVINSFSLTVAGQTAEQQVILAFREFSGSSSLSPDLEFSIPTGTFNLPTSSGLLCPGEIVFSGQFVGTMATGVSDGKFNCPPPIGVVLVEGTFEVSLEAAKASASKVGENMVLNVGN